MLVSSVNLWGLKSLEVCMFSNSLHGFTANGSTSGGLRTLNYLCGTTVSTGLSSCPLISGVSLSLMLKNRIMMDNG